MCHCINAARTTRCCSQSFDVQVPLQRFPHPRAPLTLPPRRPSLFRRLTTRRRLTPAKSALAHDRRGKDDQFVRTRSNTTCSTPYTNPSSLHGTSRPFQYTQHAYISSSLLWNRVIFCPECCSFYRGPPQFPSTRHTLSKVLYTRFSSCLLDPAVNVLWTKLQF